MPNPFGQKGGKWMSTAKLRALFAAGLTFDEIAEVNERSEGWRPDRSVVSRKYQQLGMPPRRASHRNLVPWKVRPEHNDSVYRHMLQAESRSRQGKTLSVTDKKLVARLHEQLFGRGKLMVVGYHPEVGFYLASREDYDEDIIRDPRADRYAAEALPGSPQPRQEPGGDAVPARKQPCDSR